MGGLWTCRRCRFFCGRGVSLVAVAEGSVKRVCSQCGSMVCFDSLQDDIRLIMYLLYAFGTQGGCQSCVPNQDPFLFLEAFHYTYFD